ncbi:heme NO-binding domain-containing protein [Hyalangium rubrum]|uniref:Heme NO-binding domain-containing protein n=1 Tax=Hyalangium rubrum TaxID=3103134 RepID=A0ABU5H1Z7_9BACT|nr:heme NO-binding domain-containing protein [Hyalangium sp. s54d21]MDY7226135.1 heme NO-binding domain-containing protein [Hyalangium sp. s54d21]
MHGIIFSQLRNYAQARLGERGWESLLREAKLPARVYLAFQSYPDTDAVALCGAASRLLGCSIRDVLEDVGEFMVPGLMKIYGAFIQPGWSVLEVIEHAERIHEKVRRDPHATPPRLECHRVEPHTVRVVYSSPRKLCGLGIGFVRGLASTLNQRVEVQERQCVHEGASHCEFIVKRMG